MSELIQRAYNDLIQHWKIGGGSSNTPQQGALGGPLNMKLG